MVLKFREERRGAHVHVTVFVGVDKDHLQNAGTLVLGVEEWPILEAAFALSCRLIDMIGAVAPSVAAMNEDLARLNDEVT